MRTEAELRGAIAILGASFASPLKPIIWGFSPQLAREAWVAFQALGWVAGAEESGFSETLEYATLKFNQYIQEQERKNAC